MSRVDTEQQTAHPQENSELSEEILSPGKIAWRRLKKNKLAVIGLIILITLSLGAIFAPWLSPHDWTDTEASIRNSAPDSEFWMGTDDVGRDVWGRLLYSGRISLTVGLAATGLRLLIGVIMGGLGGFYGGKVDTVIMRIADIFMSFPFLPLAITMVAIMGPSIYNIVMVIAIIGWPGVARIVRAEILSLREQEFMEAARALGISDRTQIIKHLLPNCLAPVIVAGTLGIAQAIILEAALSYLGLGVEMPTPTWGNMLNAAQSMHVVRELWWLWIPPGVCIFLSVMSLNLIGDGLRDALDPRLKE